MYEDLSNTINQLDVYYSSQYGRIDFSGKMDISDTESDLDGYDYIIAIAIGLCGTFISTSEEFAEWMEEIHKVSSEASGEYDFLQKMLGALLHHKGDAIDQIDGAFINRDGENSWGLFHRLFWGHDILSFDKDNPFFLMFKQKGIQGILQAVRHLIADTTSKQGLPLPLSSYLDYKNEKGTLSNYLIDVAQKLSTENTGNKMSAEEIYSHLFTVRAQDITAGSVARILSDIYIKIRGSNEEIRNQQIRIIAYSVNFFGEAIVGAIRQNGVPYVNAPLAVTTISGVIKLSRISRHKTQMLQKMTDDLVKDNAELIRIEQHIRNDSLADIQSALTGKGKRGVSEFIDYLGDDI